MTKTSRVSDVANFAILPQMQGTNHAEASDVKMARMANVEKLERILGDCLCNGMKASRLRKGEVDRRMMTLTDAVRLHLAYQSGEDFKLEIWLYSSIGKVITQAQDDSVERLRSVLGDYLFEAMSASNRWRTMAEISANFNAVYLSYPHGETGDCKLEVMLNFEAGRYLFVELYPS